MTDPPSLSRSRSETLISLQDVDLVGFGCKHGLVFIASLSGTGRLVYFMEDPDLFLKPWIWIRLSLLTNLDPKSLI